MQHSGKLNRPALEAGASLVIGGNRLQTGDTIQIVTSDNEGVVARVAAFGMARLLIEVDGEAYELRPWNSSDDDLPQIDGPGSNWTVRGATPR